jgi:hypothetical protein
LYTSLYDAKNVFYVRFRAYRGQEKKPKSLKISSLLMNSGISISGLRWSSLNVGKKVENVGIFHLKCTMLDESKCWDFPKMFLRSLLNELMT